MLIGHLLLLASNLSVFACASIEAESETVATSHAGTFMGLAKVDDEASLDSNTSHNFNIFSRHLSPELLHHVLQYVAKSPGKMATVNKALYSLVKEAKRFRFYQGSCWDMPELANIWKFGITNVENEVTGLAREMELITALKDAPNEQFFYDEITKNLIESKRFKGLAGQVFNYLIRTRQDILAGGIFSDEFLANGSKLVFFALRNRYFYGFYELKKDRSIIFPKFVTNEPAVNNNRIQFEYFNWVYDNPSARDYFLESLQTIDPNPNPNDIMIWISVCIHRKVHAHELIYANCTNGVQCLNTRTEIFRRAIENYLLEFSLTSRDLNDFMEHHFIINQLIEAYLRPSSLDISKVSCLHLYNDVRFGPDDPEFFSRRIIPSLVFSHPHEMAVFIICASKSNKKELFSVLLSSFSHLIPRVESMLDPDTPHDFKVIFDILEYNNEFRYQSSMLTMAVAGKHFKINSMTATEAAPGIQFVIESPLEFVELGFSETYELYSSRLNVLGLECLVEKMFNDAADIAAEEFKGLIMRHCVHASNFITGTRLRVSYKVIKILLENVHLILMLERFNVRVTCDDPRISPESIADFRNVIIIQ